MGDKEPKIPKSNENWEVISPEEFKKRLKSGDLYPQSTFSKTQETRENKK